MAGRAKVEKIVSGGQTGVDRAALDVAIDLAIPHGGYCPKGRRSESGPIPERYRLVEADADAYEVRTELNVVHSDGTLVLTKGPPDTGTETTMRLCGTHDKPLLMVDLAAAPTVEQFDRWLSDNGVRVLNIAGPRESNHPGIYDAARRALFSLLKAKPDYPASCAILSAL